MEVIIILIYFAPILKCSHHVEIYLLLMMKGRTFVGNEFSTGSDVRSQILILCVSVLTVLAIYYQMGASGFLQIHDHENANLIKHGLSPFQCLASKVSMHQSIKRSIIVRPRIYFPLMKNRDPRINFLLIYFLQ